MGRRRAVRDDADDIEAKEPLQEFAQVEGMAGDSPTTQAATKKSAAEAEAERQAKAEEARAILTDKKLLKDAPHDMLAHLAANGYTHEEAKQAVHEYNKGAWRTTHSGVAVVWEKPKE